MRPLLLKIKGINSFIQEQTIDFTPLTQLGLFGIFGPTGSGKSTILDGVTLALYGEIPRAKNLSSRKDLSGIINTHCDQGSVYYEFELGNGGERKKYFVSRHFKKDKEDSVKTNRVLLCDITQGEEPIVLEEKVTAVNHRIIEIIGLTSEDFTRSVVLPQGNFSDFLKLSGKDKRYMLERIFALQEYGSLLTHKIRTKKRRVDQEYSFIEGQLKTLEGISREDYDRLDREIKLLGTQYHHKEKAFQKTQEEYEECKALRELTMEYENAVAKREALKKQEDTIQKYRSRYRLALGAKELIPYIRQAEDLHQQLNNKKAEQSDHRAALDQVLGELAELQTQWKEIQARRDQEHPALLEKKSKLEFALEKQEKSMEIEKQLDILKKQEASIGEGMEKKRQDLFNIKESIEELRVKIKKDEKQLKGFHIPPQYRHQLFQAYRVEEDYEKLGREKAEVEKRIQDILEGELQPCWKEQKIQEKKILDLERNQGDLEKRIQTAEIEIQNIQHQNMAAILAQELRHGEHCPVCGAHEHPQKADFPKGLELEDLKRSKDEGEAALEQLKVQLQDEQGMLQERTTKIILLTEKIKEGQERERGLTEDLNILQRDYEGYQREWGIQSIKAALQDLQVREDKAESIQKRMAQGQKQREELARTLEQLQEDERNQSNERIKLQQRIEDLKKQFEDLGLEIQRVTRKDPKEGLEAVKRQIQGLEDSYRRVKKSFESKNEWKIHIEKKQKGLEDTVAELEISHRKSHKTLSHLLEKSAFHDIQEALACFMEQEECARLENRIKDFDQQVMTMDGNIRRLAQRIHGEFVREEQWKRIQERRSEESAQLESIKGELIQKQAAFKEMEGRLEEWNKVMAKKREVQRQKSRLEELDRLFLGNKFVEFISTRQLRYIAADASRQLKKITRGRYALELDGQGNFVIRDDFNGGVRRGTQTLSGGETFLTSLALALALSSHIQLKGTSPLEFFFLDEGFGTLDPELLEVVISSLERLHSDQLKVGLISHVEELRQRIPRKLMVYPAVPGINGTKVILEKS